MKIFDLIRQLSKFPANAEIYGIYKDKRGKLKDIQFIEPDNFAELLFSEEGQKAIQNFLNKEQT